MAEPRSGLPGLLRAETFEPQQVERIWEAIAAARAARRPGARRGVVLGTGLSLTAAAVLVAGVAVSSWSSPDRSPAARGPAPSSAISLTRSDGSAFERVEAGPATARVVLSDGSSLEVRPGGLVAPVELSAERVVLQLRRGSARFAVRPGGPRRWTVEAGAARVVVIGTRFEVVRGTDATRVRVEQGTVRVQGAGLPADGVQLTGGEEISVSVAGAGVTTPVKAVVFATDETTLAAGIDDPAQSVPAARVVPEKRGAEALAAAASTPSRAEAAAPTLPGGIEALLLAADRLRVAGEHASAARVLERVLHEHAGDPRAALAAFTLGRLREHALGDARAAASAYAHGLALGLSGTLAHDARAHLVRTLLVSGQRDAARGAAHDYLARHPSGSDAASMRALLRAAGEPPLESAR